MLALLAVEDRLMLPPLDVRLTLFWKTIELEAFEPDDETEIDPALWMLLLLNGAGELGGGGATASDPAVKVALGLNVTFVEEPVLLRLRFPAAAIVWLAPTINPEVPVTLKLPPRVEVFNVPSTLSVIESVPPVLVSCRADAAAFKVYPALPVEMINEPVVVSVVNACCVIAPVPVLVIFMLALPELIEPSEIAPLVVAPAPKLPPLI